MMARCGRMSKLVARSPVALWFPRYERSDVPLAWEIGGLERGPAAVRSPRFSQRDTQRVHGKAGRCVAERQIAWAFSPPFRRAVAARRAVFARGAGVGCCGASLRRVAASRDSDRLAAAVASACGRSPSGGPCAAAPTSTVTSTSSSSPTYSSASSTLNARGGGSLTNDLLARAADVGRLLLAHDVDDQVVVLAVLADQHALVDLDTFADEERAAVAQAVHRVEGRLALRHRHQHAGGALFDRAAERCRSRGTRGASSLRRRWRSAGGCARRSGRAPAP